jgi:ABC-type multidrug transport system ATPase subunit
LIAWAYEQVEGVRAINGIKLSARKYDNWISRQGYVSQADTQPERLTVWETLLYNALLRLPEGQYTVEEKIAWSAVSELNGCVR